MGLLDGDGSSSNEKRPCFDYRRNCEAGALQRECSGGFRKLLKTKQPHSYGLQDDNGRVVKGRRPFRSVLERTVSWASEV